MSDTDAQLNTARRSRDPDQLAEALARHANTLIKQGQIESARLALDEAAAIHKARLRPYDEARCSQFAATLCRLEGNLAGALARARRASALTEPGSPLAVSIAAEFGEIALAEESGPVAVAAYGRAIDEGRIAGLTAEAEATLLRKRATAQVMSGRHRAAAQDLETAHRLLLATGDATTATRTLVDAATALQQGGDADGGRRVMQQAIREAQMYGDEHALADLLLLKSAQALELGDGVRALESAGIARSHALTARAPVSYTAAAVAIAEAAETLGDRSAAYEAYFVAWMTLRDLLGREGAKKAIQPKLLALRRRWGAGAFDAVKADYEAQRRTELDV